jgi:arginine deiminase
MVHHPGNELAEANYDPVAHHFDCAVDIKQFQRDHQMLMDALREAESRCSTWGRSSPTTSRCRG